MQGANKKLNADLSRISQIIHLIDSKTQKTCEKCSRKLSQKRKNPMCVKCKKTEKLIQKGELRDTGEIKEILSTDQYDNSRNSQSELDSMVNSERLAKEILINVS